ncbi:MAG: phosphatase PAP2 family protein, partial [bacterium]
LGLVLALSILLGFLISNVGLKHIVARQRPYVTSQEVSLWWQSLGLRAERDLSFPSGHTTFASAFSTGFAVEKGKRWLPCAVLYTLLMAVSRNYLLFHYPTDVLAGILVGLIAGGLAYFIVHRAYAQAEKNGKDFAQ